MWLNLDGFIVYFTVRSSLLGNSIKGSALRSIAWAGIWAGFCEYHRD